MNLREARERAGLTQYEAADAIGVAQPQLSLWESGKTTPKINRYRQIGEAYGLTPNQVFSAVVESQMEAFDAGKRQTETPSE